jgi:hypothetical protein
VVFAELPVAELSLDLSKSLRSLLDPDRRELKSLPDPDKRELKSTLPSVVDPDVDAVPPKSPLDAGADVADVVFVVGAFVTGEALPLPVPLAWSKSSRLLPVDPELVVGKLSLMEPNKASNSLPLIESRLPKSLPPEASLASSLDPVVGLVVVVALRSSLMSLKESRSRVGLLFAST